MNDATKGEPSDGFRALVGYHVDTAHQRATLRLEIGPQHLNRSGLVHGGVIMTTFDAALGYACMAGHDDPDYPRIVTVTMSTNFMSAMQAGTLHVEARVTGGGRSMVFAEARARDGEGRTVATATGTFRRLRGRSRAGG